MEMTQPEGHFSPRQFATIVGNMGEGSVRVALREGRLTALKDENGRRWISEAEVTKRFALELSSPVTRATTLAKLRRNAETARAELSPDDELVANAEAFLRGENPRVNALEHDPWDIRVEPKQLELVAAGD